MSPSPLHPLSCTRCKQRKVKCSRVLPRCHKCQEHDFECSYPERRGRRGANARNSSRTRSAKLDVPSISSLHERLKRLEEQCIPLSTHSHMGSRSGSVRSRHTGSDLETRPDTPETTTSTSFNDDGGVSSLGPFHSSTLLSPNFAARGRDTPRADDVSVALTKSSIEEKVHLFQASIDKVQRLISKNLSHDMSVACESGIPKDLARSWLEHCLSVVPESVFPNLVRFDLLRQMPDILELPHVHVDSVMVMVYYCVLNIGASIPVTQGPTHREWTRKLYLRSLQAMLAWQRDASGTGLDMAAAALMARTATENFDLPLVSSLHRLACDYAQAWNLHRADAEDGALRNILGRPISDEDRRSFWELVQLDLLLRLLHNQPPGITSIMDSWKVNLPWFTTGLEKDQDSMPAVYFLVRARLGFITADFFHLIHPADGQQPAPDVLEKTHEMCEKIEEMYSEWDIDYDDLHCGTHSDIKQSWLKAEVALLGPISMVCMLRHATALVRGTAELEDVDAELARHPMVLKASRRMLETASLFLQRYPDLGIVSIFFSYLRIDLPYTYVARNIMETEDQSRLEDDKAVLDQIAQVLGAMSQEIVALKPLAWAAYRLNLELECR